MRAKLAGENDHHVRRRDDGDVQFLALAYSGHIANAVLCTVHTWLQYTVSLIAGMLPTQIGVLCALYFVTNNTREWSRCTLGPVLEMCND